MIHAMRRERVPWSQAKWLRCFPVVGNAFVAQKESFTLEMRPGSVARPGRFTVHVFDDGQLVSITFRLRPASGRSDRYDGRCGLYTLAAAYRRLGSVAVFTGTISRTNGIGDDEDTETFTAVESDPPEGWDG